MNVAVKDEAGNITKGTVMVLQGYGGETQTGEQHLITAATAIDNLIYGKTQYISEDDLVHGYEDSEFGKDGIAIRIAASSTTADGYLKGYAQLLNTKYALRWGGFDGQAVATGDSEAYVHIPATLFTSSGRNLRLRIVVEEYKDASCTTRIKQEEQNIPISIDVSGPQLNVSYNRYTSTATIAARDSISGLKSAVYRVSTDGGRSFGEWAAYNAPFEASGNLVFEVKGEDRLGNISSYSTTGLTEETDADLVDSAETNVYKFSSRTMVTYLIGSNKANAEQCPTPF